MSSNMLLRCICSIGFSLMLAWLAFDRYDNDVGSELNEKGTHRYLPYVDSFLLPLVVFVTIVIAMFNGGIEYSAKILLSFFGIFVHIGVYYIVLSLRMPFFRKRISARACAMLWFIPNYLYILNLSFMQVDKPLFLVYFPGKIIKILFFAWFLGFFVILTFKILEHLLFRYCVLHNASPVTDLEINTILNRILEEAGIKKTNIKIVISSFVNTPLSIGIFNKSMRIVLPQKNYTKSELELILKHEVIHICREDSISKFFMVFCAAMCWFNPLVWVAMKKSAEDMELSCDETVLLNTDEQVRKQYATLILDTAGDQRGFTTCLSSSAKSMRYRLKNIMKPDKKASGAIVVGVVFFIIAISGGYVSLAYSKGNGEQLIYENQSMEKYVLRSVLNQNDEYNREYEIVDENAFHNYLSTLQLSEIVGNYSYSSNNKISCVMDTPRGREVIQLFDDMLKISKLYGENPISEIYYVRDGIDWNYINSIIVAHPAVKVMLYRDGECVKTFVPQLEKLIKYNGETETIVYENSNLGSDNHGVFTSEKFDKAELVFSQYPSGNVEVLITNRRKKKESFVTLENNNKFTLEDYPSQYKIFADFKNCNGDLYKAEYLFNVGLPE